MNMTISTKVEDDYLLITASGSIADAEGLGLHTKRYVNEILAHGAMKVIIDETDVQYHKSLLDVIGLVESYSDVIPAELRSGRLAIVFNSDIKPIAEFWQFQATEKGYDYKAFSTIEEARDFLRRK